MLKKILIALAAVAVALIAPYYIYSVTLMTVLCFIILACSFNLLLGYTGLLCFGQAAFFGSAAYITGWLLKTYHLSPELGILGGALFAAVLGWLVGVVAVRRTGITFAMITFALAQFVYFILLQSPFTGGEDGMQNIPREPVLGLIDVSDNFVYYYVVLIITIVAVAAFYRIVHSPFGEILRAIRDNEARVESLGFKSERFKVLSITLSAALAGLAGGMKATVFQFATLTDLDFMLSAEVIIMTLLGGIGTFFGPIVGASFIIYLNENLASFGDWALIVQGIILLLVILFFRRGIVGEFNAWRRSRNAK